MRIIDNVRPDRQTVMFSATFPRAMEALARRILNKPIEVQVGGRSIVCSDVEQHVVSTLITLLGPVHTEHCILVSVLLPFLRTGQSAESDSQHCVPVAYGAGGK